ncbi:MULTISPECIES: DUF7004 family protein [Nostoc]|uniref:Uncharacterized protein n=1 Tax=Nostoc paludosum FACHB-159 TaxID=2692908 RepID=A0ABR8KEA9_9NOSO|nr:MULTISPECIES: hypothetical protein [Nostoc]MBD2681435.1 hypothetical protein [Nostoc sp. FACHB-857]MBD2737893.1 hypothetical protein [Nostoc paludosum FACHB-159]
MRVLKSFSGRATISFKIGKKDNYMVTINNKPPKDTHFLRFFSAYRDKQAIWEAIKDVAQQIDRQTEDLSSFKCPKFPETKMSYAHLSNEARRKIELVQEVFFHAYAACLIAEERKADVIEEKIKFYQHYQKTGYSRLGKRIKLLAAYQLLFEGLSVESAANFSVDKKYWVIDQECKKRGI